MPFWTMLKEGNDHFEVTHLEPKVDVCDRHYVFDAQPPENSTKPLVFNPTGRCPAYQVPQEIAGPALEKQRNDEYQLAQLVKENVPTAPIVMGHRRRHEPRLRRQAGGDCSRSTTTKDGLHAPPIHPGMPAPTLSGPRENPQDGGLASNAGGEFVRRIVWRLFDAKPSGQQSQASRSQDAANGAATDASSQSHSNFFASLFEPKKPQTPAPPMPKAPSSPGLNPNPEPRRTEPAKSEAARAEPQKAEPQIAQAPKTEGQIAGRLATGRHRRAAIRRQHWPDERRTACRSRGLVRRPLGWTYSSQ